MKYDHCPVIEDGKCTCLKVVQGNVSENHEAGVITFLVSGWFCEVGGFGKKGAVKE